MAINLVRKYSRKIKGGESLVIPIIFKQECLLISALCPNCRNTWYKAGYLSQIIDILPLRKVQVSNKILVPLNNSQLQNFAYFNSGYKLKFEAVNWIDYLTLNIHLPNMSLFQSEPSASPINPSDMTGQAEYTFTLTATPTKVLIANPNRKGIVVRNKNTSNKAVYGGFKATVDAASAPYVIPAGTTMEQVDDFPPGDFYLVAPTGNVDVVVMEIF